MTVVWFALLVGLLVVVHELGHLAMARLFDVKVLRISIGLGPTLWRFRRRETEWVIAALPLGGYVKMLGEDPADEIAHADRGRAFPHKPRWQRALVVLGGPLANLLLPVVVFFHLYAVNSTALSSTIGSVFAGQPAWGVLAPGDRIVAIDGAPVRTWDEVTRIVSDSPGKDLRVTVERAGDDKPLTKVLTPRAHLRRDALGSTTEIGLLGVAPEYRLPQIGVLERLDASGEPSPAARAGLRTFDVVTSVQGRAIYTWDDLEHVLAQNRGEAMLVTYLRPVEGPGFASLARLAPATVQLFPARVPHNRYDTGIRSAETFLHDVAPGTPAARAGLAVGDEILAVDGNPVRSWDLLEQIFEEKRDRDLVLAWRTPTGERHEATLRLEPRAERDEYAADSTRYVFGAEPSRARRAVPTVDIEGRPLYALTGAVGATLRACAITGRVLVELLRGDLPVDAIGGPITVYHLAGVAAGHGAWPFLTALALVSLNLGLLNLLPVPLLDGGHLVYLAAVAIWRRPPSPRMRRRATWIGLAVLGAILLLALRNDLVKFWPR